MPTLQGAIAELVAVVRAVNGIRHAPDEPAAQLTVWPAAFSYATESASRNQPPDMAHDFHNIQIAVLMPKADYRIMMKTMLPLYEPIRNELFQHRNGDTSTNYKTFGNITATLGPIDWGGPEVFGWIFTVTNMEIEDILT